MNVFSLRIVFLVAALPVAACADLVIKLDFNLPRGVAGTMTNSAPAESNVGAPAVDAGAGQTFSTNVPPVHQSQKTNGFSRVAPTSSQYPISWGKPTWTNAVGMRYQNPTNWAVSAWIYPTVMPTNNSYKMLVHDNFSGGGEGFTLELYRPVGDEVRLRTRFKLGGVAGYYTNISDYVVSSNTWQFVAVTVDHSATGALDVATLWRGNGNDLFATSVSNNFGTYLDEHYHEEGLSVTGYMRSHPNTAGFIGSFDNVRIYLNEKLTGEQVRAIMQFDDTYVKPKGTLITVN